MDIDSINEIISLGTKDLHQSMIIKRKRTKRRRPPSPASAVFTASSCSSGGDGGSGGRGCDEKMGTNKILLSESLCSDISNCTEEDEDMANCLILLAQSGHQNSISTRINISQNNIEKEEYGTGSPSIKSDKNSSRKLKEMTIKTSSTIIGKASVYVYECKTCNRSFPSFQALGGHRTSHKKHKPTMEMEERTGVKLSNPDDDHHHGKEKENKLFKIRPSSLLPLEISKKNPNGKIHECSICGAEFSSGQALGGHMRRHRTPTSAATPSKNILELDLNLPAQPEHDHQDSQFELSLFSSQAFLDCQF